MFFTVADLRNNSSQTSKIKFMWGDFLALYNIMYYDIYNVIYVQSFGQYGRENVNIEPNTEPTPPVEQHKYIGLIEL